MRYFYISVFLIAALAVSIAGLRGTTFHKPPLEVFPDMKRQPKLRPQKTSHFFADQRNSRPPVAGAVPINALLDDNPVATGRIPGSTNYVETSPFPMTAEFLARGKEQFTIYCSPCHSAVGDGNGIITKYGLVKAGNFHDPRLVRATDGELFNTISYGKNQMPAYASQVSVTNRWAAIAYLRVLQRSRLGSVDDVPAAYRSQLKP